MIRLQHGAETREKKVQGRLFPQLFVFSRSWSSWKGVCWSEEEEMETVVVEMGWRD